LNTRELLRRKNIHLDDYSCVHCASNVEEILFHLLFDCPFCNYMLEYSWKSFRFFKLSRFNFEYLFFLEILITMCSSIWSVRNDVIFRGLPTSVHRCKNHLQSRVCSSYPIGKRRSTACFSFMARSLCVILSILFVSFFVS
jgi:hypothetical protein